MTDTTEVSLRPKIKNNFVNYYHFLVVKAQNHFCMWLKYVIVQAYKYIVMYNISRIGIQRSV